MFETFLLCYLGIQFFIAIISAFQGSKTDRMISGYISKCKHGVRENKSCEKCESERMAAYARSQAIQRKKNRLKSESKKRWESERRRVVNYYTSKINNLKKISPKEFEATVSRLYKRLGYETTLTDYVGDEGKDIIAKIDGKTYFIECKQFCQDNKVSRPYLQKLFGAMAEHKVDGGVLVTTSEFTNPAIEYADRVGIDLVSKQRLREMFQNAYQGKKIEKINLLCKGCGKDVIFKFESDNYKSHHCDCGTVTDNSLNIDSVERMLNPGKNQCIKCGNKMKLINGRYGEFYGCSTFPKCDHIVKKTDSYISESIDWNRIT